MRKLFPLAPAKIIFPPAKLIFRPAKIILPPQQNFPTKDGEGGGGLLGKNSPKKYSKQNIKKKHFKKN